MKEETNRKSPFESPWEIVMEGVPEAIRPIVEQETTFFTAQNHRFVTIEPFSDSGPAHRWIHLVALSPDKLNHHIGVIELQELPGRRTLFRVPAYGRWDKRFGFDYALGTELFLALLERVLSELSHLGFWEPSPTAETAHRRLGFELPHDGRFTG